MAIPGIRQIVTTEYYLLKAGWTILILVSFGFGIYNVSYAANNYYQFDVITNIERITPENVTYPAITLCASPGYFRDHYRNGSLVKKRDYFFIGYDNISRIKNFFELKYSYFMLTGKDKNITHHLDYFKIPDDSFYDCVRFNGMTSENIELFKASSITDYLQLLMEHFYIEKINGNEYYNYSFSEPFIYVYIGGNSLNSFEKIESLKLHLSNRSEYSIKIDKDLIEVKLPEPYNPCRESSFDKPSHQSNCIFGCIFREIKSNYNCTYPLSLFAVHGLTLCRIARKTFTNFKREFYEGCQNECLEDCFNEKYTYDIKTELYDKVDIINNYTAFRFFLRDLSTLNISQIPKIDGFTFLNNIGGGLGLFMGIAFPTLIEFFQFVFEIFMILFVQKIN